MTSRPVMKYIFNGKCGGVPLLIYCGDAHESTSDLHLFQIDCNTKTKHWVIMFPFSKPASDEQHGSPA